MPVHRKDKMNMFWFIVDIFMCLFMNIGAIILILLLYHLYINHYFGWYSIVLVFASWYIPISMFISYKIIVKKL